MPACADVPVSGIADVAAGAGVVPTVLSIGFSLVPQAVATSTSGTAAARKYAEAERFRMNAMCFSLGLLFLGTSQTTSYAIWAIVAQLSAQRLHSAAHCFIMSLPPIFSHAAAHARQSSAHAAHVVR